jgi:hypothetical protein
MCAIRFPTAGTAVLAAGVLACSNAGGVADRGEVLVTLQRTNEAVAPQVTGLFLQAEPTRATAAAVAPDTIEALTIVVTDIEFLEVADSADTAEAGGWIALSLDEPATLDLLSLPTEDASPVVIAAGSVPIGEYRKVRLYVSDATIVFKGPISVGQSVFDSGVEYPVRIPSADQSGIKTDVAFSVGDEAAEVNLLFASSATFANLTATGSGRVQMAPVLRARSQNDE